MKKIKYLIIPLILLILTGCTNDYVESEEKVNTNNDNKKTYLNSSEWISIYVDRDTCVEYAVYNGGYGKAMVVLYDSDSNVKVNEICMNNKGE